jgi:hypothetical protein
VLFTVPLPPRFKLSTEIFKPAFIEAVAVPLMLNNRVTDVPEAIVFAPEPESVRLLYAQAGIVWAVPLNSTIPDPALKAPNLFMVTAPPILSVPPLVMVMVPFLLDPAD